MSVFRRPSKKWAYEFIHQGVRYGKYHYLTKAEAREAEAAERARLKKAQTSTTFLEIAKADKRRRRGVMDLLEEDDG